MARKKKEAIIAHDIRDKFENYKNILVYSSSFQKVENYLEN